MDINFDGGTIPVSVSRSRRRKRCSMRVNEDGVFIKTGPFHSESDIRSFLSKHRGWVIRNYTKFRLKCASLPALADDSFAPFRGEAWLIVEVSDGSTGFSDGMFRYLPLSDISVSDAIAARLADAYLSAAVEELESLTQKWSLLFSDPAPILFRLKEMQTRWGSCSSTGAISLNWRLIMAKPEVFEYVFIHEMCHLRHRGHDRGFWLDVQKRIPDFNCLRAELRRRNHLLMNFPFKVSSPRTLATLR
ncbi:MAG: M48 family metallopeptidase [Victivallales bacterium]|nr:M48 family metallopeptidase [Victivallales bacterium]